MKYIHIPSNTQLILYTYICCWVIVGFLAHNVDVGPCYVKTEESFFVPNIHITYFMMYIYISIYIERERARDRERYKYIL